MGDSNATDDERAAALAELLGDLPDRLRDEADAAVADANDADDLVDRLSALSERRGGDEGADETVASSSVADLRAELDAAGADDADGGSDGATPAPAGDGDHDDDGVFGRVRSTFDGVRDRVAGDDADGDSDEESTTVDGDAGTDTDADADSPALPGIERSRELAADARSASSSVPSLDRGALPTLDRDRTRDVVRAARDRAGAGADELKRTVRDADPKQAAVWGLATGVTVANPAIAAGYSTAALLSGAVLGGSAVGAYASSHDDTVFDGLDPTVMARRANAGASAGAGARNLNGKSAGAMLGASAYLAEELTPESYAHWVAEADPESVLRGAEMGAGRGADSPALSGPRSGAALGAGFGLLYGLASDDGEGDGEDDAVRELLDEDLREEYTGRLGGDPGDGAERVESRPADEGESDGVTIPDAETGDDVTADAEADQSADDGDSDDSGVGFVDGADDGGA